MCFKMPHSSISRFLVFANIVAMLSNGQYFDGVLNERHDLGLFQGDIILTEAQRRIIMSGDITSYTAMEGGNWPNGIIPYVIIDSSNSKNISDYDNPEKSFMFKDFNATERQLILESMERIQDTSCVRFVEKKMHHQYYINIANRLQLNKTTNEWTDIRDCSATVGRDITKKYEGQRLEMSSSCFICQEKDFCTAM